MSFPPIEQNVAGIPLAALPKVIIDCETDGLDVSKARIVEIALTTDDKRVKPLATLVNPQIPIADSASKIHGITNAQVSDAPDFPTAIEQIKPLTRNRVWFGYSIGFDLAILQNEHHRHHMPWTTPRALDIAHLANIALPDIAQYSLDRVAGWLNINIAKRHRALSDAQTAALILQKLIPHLQKKGIHALAQAEQHCRQLSQLLDDEARAKWLCPYATKKKTYNEQLLSIDTTPYRYRVKELMSHPLQSITENKTVTQTLQYMSNHQVSSLVVHQNNRPKRLITEHDIIKALSDQGEKLLVMPVTALPGQPILSIKGSEFAYRAILMMQQNQIKHLVVSNAKDELIGLITGGDLLKQISSSAITLGERLESASDAIELSGHWGQILTVTQSLLKTGIKAVDIAAIISRELRALTGRACFIAEQQLLELGIDMTDIDYAMLVLGSGGRGESLLAMDQDNAIVYADTTTKEQVSDLHQLACRVSDILNQAGLPYCPGNIMASNPNWCKSVSAWQDSVTGWINSSNNEDLLNTDIYFDAACVYGNDNMASQLRRWSLETAAHSTIFTKYLAMHAGKITSPTGLFGQLKTTHGRLDLKRHGLFPIVTAARAMAIQSNTYKRTTQARLLDAGKHLQLPHATITSLIKAHHLFINLILKQQLADVSNGLAMGNSVAVSELSSYDKQQLKWALDQVSNIPGLLGVPLFAT